MFMPSVYNKRAVIGGKSMDVCDYQSFGAKKEILVQDTQAAVEIKVNDRNVILPIRSNSGNTDRPGLYTAPNSPIHFLSLPKTDEEMEIYSPDESKILSFDKNDMQKMIEEKERYEVATNAMLESSDSCTVPPLKESDTPTMRALKEAIIAKNMDIDMYKERFGENFPNDKRKLNDDNVTLFILERFCDCLDMEADLVLRDADGNIANPMGKIITANIVPGNANNVIIEDLNDEVIQKDNENEEESEED